jgi:GT2 family glycosyltransferase
VTERSPSGGRVPVTNRPPVSVIVPFAGSDNELRVCLGRLGQLLLRAGDEILVADNRPGAEGGGAAHGVRLVAADGVRAPGFARNRAAAVAHGEWLVLIDADAKPVPQLVDRYFDPPPADRTGVLAGGIVDIPGSRSSAARYAAGRGQMSQRVTLDRAGTPYAQTANMAVRRGAFDEVGGFDESARSGEDADLCFRLARAGWTLEERPAAVVEHPTRATLGALLTQMAHHGSGAAWLNRHYPGEFPALGARWLAGRLGRAAVAAARGARRGDRDAVNAGLIEVCEACAFEAGRLLLSNAARAD